MSENLLNNSSQPLFVECWFCGFFGHSGFAILTLVAILTFLFDYIFVEREGDGRLHRQPVAQREILNGGDHNFHIFSSVFYFGRTDLKLIEKQEKL